MQKKNIDLKYDIPAVKETRDDDILIDGNTALSLGLVDAGIKLLSGYPITPASSIMHTLAKILPAYGGIVHQAEDEISAIGAAIGSYYGGVPAATATSGPGLSLKQEFIGYAAVSETPIIIIDVQRSGPSTGMPTKTEQSDLLSAIYGAHGDNTQVVISVGNIYECFYSAHLARYIAEKLRIPVIILSDFQMANSYKVLSQPEIVDMKEIDKIPENILNRFKMNRLPDDIEMVRKIQSDPGKENDMRRITGLNTDEEGKVNYFAKTNQRSHRVRNEKIHCVRRALQKPDIIGGIEEGDVLVIGWGSTQGAIEEAVLSCREEGLAVGGINFRIVYPLPLMLKEILSKFKKVITVELAYGDDKKRPPLAMFLRSKTLIDVESVICEATGRPTTPKKIKDKIKEVING